MDCIESTVGLMMQSPQLRRVVMAALLAMAIANTLVWWNARELISQGYGGFTAFYTAGKILVSGRGYLMYDLPAQWEVQKQIAPEVKIRSGPLPYVHPPFEAVLFAPFTFLTYSTAILLWTFFKLGILLAIPYVVTHASPLPRELPPWFLAVLSLGTYPVFVDFEQGHDAVLLAFLFAIAFACLAKGRELTAGIALGLALFKFHLVVPLVVILWIAGKRHLVASFAATAIALLAVSLAIVGWNGVLAYPGYVLALNRIPGAGMVTPEYLVNLRGLFTLFFGRAPWQWLLLLVALGGVVWAGVLWKKLDNRRLPEAFGLTVLVAILTSLYAYSYDLTLLLIPLIGSLTTGVAKSTNSTAAKATRPPNALSTPDRLVSACLTAAILLLLCTPLYWFLKLHWHAECLMSLPLAVAAFTLARR